MDQAVFLALTVAGIFVLLILGGITMAAIENLDSAIAALAAKVDQVLQTPKPDPALEARIQADADAVAAQTSRLDGFLTPTP